MMQHVSYVYLGLVKKTQKRKKVEINQWANPFLTIWYLAYELACYTPPASVAFQNPVETPPLSVTINHKEIDSLLNVEQQKQARAREKYASTLRGLEIKDWGIRCEFVLIASSSSQLFCALAGLNTDILSLSLPESPQSVWPHWVCHTMEFNLKEICAKLQTNKEYKNK